MRYAYVENGSVVNVFEADLVPAHKTSFLPVVVVKPAITSNEAYLSPTYQVGASEVQEVWGVRERSLAERQQSVRDIRRAQYPELGEAADALVKLIAANPGLSLPADVQAYVDACAAIKAANPIPQA